MDNKIITVNPENLECSDSILRIRSRPTEINTIFINNLLSIMIDVLYGVPYGTGISAVQLGIPIRAFIVNLERIPGKEIIAINPTIELLTGPYLARKEGCLSLPNYSGTVKRKNKVTIKALDRNGKEYVYSSKGYEAAVIQHELDHLEGILYWDRMDDGKKPQPIIGSYNEVTR